MIPVTPNPILGISLHSVGAVFAANCYAPQKYIKRWSWEIFWMAQAVWCWFLWPIIGAALTIESAIGNGTTVRLRVPGAVLEG